MESIEECAEMEIEAFEEKEINAPKVEPQSYSLTEIRVLIVSDPNAFKNRSIEECAKREIEAFEKKNLEASKKKDTKAFKDEIYYLAFVQIYNHDYIREIMVLIVSDPNPFNNLIYNHDYIREIMAPKVAGFKSSKVAPVYRVVRDPNEFKNWSIEECAKRNLELSKKTDTKAFEDEIYYLASVHINYTYENRVYNNDYIRLHHPDSIPFDNIPERHWLSPLIMALFVPIMALFAPIMALFVPIMAVFVPIMALFVAPRWLSLLDPNAFNNWSRQDHILSRQDHILEIMAPKIAIEDMFEMMPFIEQEINAPKVERRQDRVRRRQDRVRVADAPSRGCGRQG